MSSGNGLGDFFLTLGIKTDKNSVETANKSVDSVSNSLNKLIGTARNAAVVAGVLKSISGSAKDANLSYSMHMGTEALNTWRTALKIAGQDSNAFISKMSELDTKFRKLSIDGTFDKSLGQSLGLLGLDYQTMAEQDANERTRSIMNAASRKYKDAITAEEKSKVAIIVGDILGSSGRGLFEYMAQTGKTLDYFLDRAAGSIFTSDDAARRAQEFNEEFKLAQESLMSMAKLFGTELGTALNPLFKDLNKWIGDNKEAIQTAIQDLASGIATFIEDVKPILKLLEEPLRRMTGAIASTTSGFDKLMNGDFKGAAKDLTLGKGYDLAKDKYKKIFGTDSGSDYNILIRKMNPLAKWTDAGSVKMGLMTQEEYDAYWGTNGIMAQVDSSRVLKDGIVRPNGQVTQVAPDDWVFAARNIGDLAAAFMPAGAGSGAGPVEIQITQNFTVNGGNDIPQLLKQQAYNGTLEGLKEMTQKAGTRMQLMPGTL